MQSNDWRTTVITIAYIYIPKLTTTQGQTRVTILLHRLVVIISLNLTLTGNRCPSSSSMMVGRIWKGQQHMSRSGDRPVNTHVVIHTLKQTRLMSSNVGTRLIVMSFHIISFPPSLDSRELTNLNSKKWCSSREITCEQVPFAICRFGHVFQWIPPVNLSHRMVRLSKANIHSTFQCNK